MKIIIIGFGAMGKEIYKVLERKQMQVVAIVDPSSDIATHKSVEDVRNIESDVYIDFSVPGSVLDNIRTLCRPNSRFVIGVTGWYDRLEEVRSLIQKSKASLIYSPNFSIGVNIFNKIIAESSKIIHFFGNFDIAILDIHHKNKLDSPSGTAYKLAQTILSNVPRKNSLVIENLNRKILPTEMQISSLRIGESPGTHTVYFDAGNEKIEISHELRNRFPLAEGAVFAAEWLMNKNGFFNINDMLEDIIQVSL